MDKETYKLLAKKENEVWGQLHTDGKREKIIQKDREAAQVLRSNRDLISIGRYLKEYAVECETALSLACGEGRAERELLKAGCCAFFDAIDISDAAISKAREIAARDNLPIKYRVGDLNDVVLPENKYDLIVTQTCLHHVVNLEHLAQQINNSLKPNGILWIFDYIGESKFQYSDERLRVVNDILELLPDCFKWNELRNMTIKKIVRPDPDNLISPFEAIRSAEIMPLFEKYFEVIEKREFDSILHLLCQAGMKNNYLIHENGKTVFELLHFMDRFFVNNDILEPSGGQYIMKKRVSIQN